MNLPTHSTHAEWVNSPAWSLQEHAHEGRVLLVLTGGADETYVVDEAVPDSCVHRVFQAWQDNTLASLLDDKDCGAAVRQIQRAGALIPRAAIRPAARYSLLWLGDARAALVPALTTLLAEHDVAHAVTDEPLPGLPTYCEDPGQADIVLVLRSTMDWQTALNHYAALDLQHPHLFIDMAYHHTLGIGPYVVPPETACVACLGHRVTHRWGDLAGPAQPAVSTRTQAVAALLAPLLLTPEARLPFLEQCVSLNLQTFSSTRDQVFQLPWCPACGARHEPLTGALDLPWQALPAQSPASPSPRSAH